MKREEGYYWVKYSTHPEAAFWDGKKELWYLPASKYGLTDEDLRDIDEIRLRSPNI